MQAIIMDAPGAMRVGEWDTPRPGAGEVLVRVEAVGICVGDTHIYAGKSPYAKFPVIGGHEIAGVIEATGESVADFAGGERVVVEPFLGCGTCYPCRIGKSNCCADLQIIGVTRPGGFAEFVLAPATHVHRVPEGLSVFEAAFAEPVAIGVQACRRAQLGEGESVLILGCGPIGLALIEVARAHGAQVFAADVRAERREFAATLGAHTFDGADLLPAIMELTNGEGMPVVIEATGVPAVMEQTVSLVASGGRVVIVGLAKRGEGVTFPGLDFTRKELTVLGSRTSVDCFPEALQLLVDSHITYPRVATPLCLWDSPQIFAEMARNPEKMHKGVLLPTIPALESKIEPIS